MRHLLTILSHEIRILLVNPSTYVAGVLFLGIMGFVFTGILDSYSKTAQETSPSYVFFTAFFIPVLFMVPLLTMKSFAEERRQGTIETLLTTPVTTAEVVVGKFGAAYFLYMMLWAATGGFFYILNRFADDSRFLDPGPLIGGYAFIAASGLLFIAIGIFASSLSKNQAVAGILAFTFLFALLVGVPWLRELVATRSDALDPVRAAIESAHIRQHFEDFSRGVVDSRQILFYLSSTMLALIFSILSIEARLLHS